MISFGCGGWSVQTQGLYFENVKYRTLHRWNWDLVKKLIYNKYYALLN